MEEDINTGDRNHWAIKGGFSQGFIGFFCFLGNLLVSFLLGFP